MAKQSQSFNINSTNNEHQESSPANTSEAQNFRHQSLTMASAFSTTAFFILFFLVASPFPAPAARKLKEDASAPEPVCPPATQKLAETLQKLVAQLSDLIDPAKAGDLANTAVDAINEVLKIASEMEPLLYKDFQTVESDVLPMIPELEGKLLPLVDNLPSDLKENVGSLATSAVSLLGSLITKVAL